MKKSIGIILLIGLLFLIGLGIYSYAPDRSIEELKEEWSYDNSKFVEIDGMDVHYRINGNGQPLVLLHGTGASLHTWEGWTSILEENYQIISVDLPAFGMTGPSLNRDYSIGAYVNFVDAFLAKIGIDSFALAGNSLGGGISWNYAAAHPQKVKALILVDPSGFKQRKKLPLALRITKSKTFSPLLKKFSPKFLFSKSLKEVYYDDSKLDQAIIDRYYELFRREGNRQAYIDRGQTPNNYNVDLLNTIDIPTLILWGANDEWITSDDAVKFKKRIKNAKVIIYNKMGHVPMEEDPEKTANDVNDFLTKINVNTLDAHR